MLEETEQKDIKEEESASEASEIRISDNKSSEDECSNLGGIKFTVKRDWEGQVNYYPANEEHFIIYYPERLEEKNKLIWKQNGKQKKTSNFREAFKNLWFA